MDEKDKKIAYLEKLIALMPGNIYWKDRQGRYLGTNNQFARIVKLPDAKAIIGKSDYDLMSEELADRLYATDQEIMQSDQEQVLEEIGFDEAGNTAIYLTKKVPLHDEKGKVIGILGTSMDISASKRMLKELQESQIALDAIIKLKTDFISNMNYLENIIALLPGNIYWKNRQGVYLGCNDNAAKTVGTTKENIINKTLHDFVDKKYADVISAIDEEIMATGIEKTIEEDAFDQYQQPATYLTRKTPLRDEKGEVIGLLGVSLDISDRKRYEQALKDAKEKAEAANQAKSNFLAVVSHELRIPLTGILGMAQLLDGDNLYSEQRDQLTDLIKSGEHLLALINDLLDIAKLEAGKMEFHPASMNLRALIEEMATIIGHQVKLKGLELLIDYPQDVPANIIADVRALRQVILNLAGNAIKFTENGYVIIKVTCIERTNTQVTLALSVEDTGIGIPADKKEMIFDRFAQVDNSRVRSYGGAGLGLAITREYVEAMGGEISVESEEDKGSIFTCKIPFELANDTRSANPWDAYRAHVKILIVDDTLRGEVLRRHIASSLCQVCEGKTALHTISAAQQMKGPFDIVIIDQDLTHTSALELCKAILNKPNPHVPMLLLLAAKQSLPSQEALKKSGFYDLLIKPVQPTEMLLRLTAAWEKWREKHSIKNSMQLHAFTKEKLRPRVLLVEDDPIIQRVHSRLLEKFGCQTDLAPTGASALTLFADHFYDIVFLDIGLPDLNGFEVAKRMRHIEAERGYTPIIGITGYNSVEDKQKALLAGMDEVAIKPVRPEELRGLVEKCLNKK